MGLNYSHNKNFSVNRSNGSGDYLFLLFKTSATIILSGKTVIAPKNSVIIYNKNSPQIYGASKGETVFTNDFIHLDIIKEKHLFTKRNIPLDTIIEVPNSKQLHNILKNIHLEYIFDYPCRTESIRYLLLLLFTKLSEMVDISSTNISFNGNYDTLVSLRASIYNAPERKWNISSMAKEVNLSPSYFQSLYKQLFGISCMNDVISSKIDFAKYHLMNTPLSVKEIAQICGYDNDVHFMRQFKKNTSVTPTKFRQDYSNN